MPKTLTLRSPVEPERKKDMDVDEAYIEAEAYYKDPAKERYFVKITFIGLDMFINSFVVQPTRFEGQPMWVQEPRYMRQRRWVSHVEFNKHSKLWQIIEDKARAAVEAYEEDPLKDKVIEPTDYELEHIEEGLKKAFENI